MEKFFKKGTVELVGLIAGICFILSSNFVNSFTGLFEGIPRFDMYSIMGFITQILWFFMSIGFLAVGVALVAKCRNLIILIGLGTALMFGIFADIFNIIVYKDYFEIVSVLFYFFAIIACIAVVVINTFFKRLSFIKFIFWVPTVVYFIYIITNCVWGVINEAYIQYIVIPELFMLVGVTGVCLYTTFVDCESVRVVDSDSGSYL